MREVGVRGSAPVTFSQAVGRNLKPSNASKVQRTYHKNYARHLPPQDERIGDLGCSEGLFLEYLARRGFRRLVGVDLDGEALSACRERLLRYTWCEVELVEGDILTYLKGVDDEWFSCLVLNDVIEHFKREELLLLLAETLRVLKDGGTLIAKTGNMENPFNLGLLFGDFTHELGFTRRSLCQCLVLAGYERNKIRVEPVVPAHENAIDLLGEAVRRCGGIALKVFAGMLRIRIGETRKLIYCVARK